VWIVLSFFAEQMALSISYACKSGRSKQRRAARNLYALLAELPGPQQILLDSLGTVFRFHVSDRESGSASYWLRTIELDLKEFAQFQYEQRRRPHRNQRWALTTLKEEVIHYLDDHLAFTKARVWKRAARSELQAPNKARQQLCTAQREYDSSDTWIKLSPEEYAADNTLLDKIAGFIAGAQEPVTELLVDLFLARDYLIHKKAPVNEQMRVAFPHTYTLALEFEQAIERHAARVAGKRRMNEKLHDLQQAWRALEHKT
jgi:hypothetical protein